MGPSCTRHLASGIGETISLSGAPEGSDVVETETEAEEDAFDIDDDDFAGAGGVEDDDVADTNEKRPARRVDIFSHDVQKPNGICRHTCF